MTTRRTAIVIDALCCDCEWHEIGDDEQQVLRQADHHASTAHHLVSFNYERRVIFDGSQPEFCMGEIQAVLFDVPALEVPEVPPGASYGTRVTVRNAARLALGIHPATGVRLLEGSHTCGECVHFIVRTRNRSWFKCAQHTLGTSRSLASDIRKSWPACELFRPHPE